MDITSFLTETNKGLTNMPEVVVTFSRAWTSNDGYGTAFDFLQGKTKNGYYRVDGEYERAIAMEFTPSISLKSISVITESSNWISQIRVVDDHGNEKTVPYPGRSGTIILDFNWQVKKLYWERSPEAGASGGYAPYAKQFLGFVIDRSVSQKFLVQSENTIKKFSDSWQDIGAAPVTEQMFKEHGMTILDNITEAQWSGLPVNSKVLAYSETGKTFMTDITSHNLYNSEDKLYRGTGMIETDTEELPAYRKTLVITADHQECTFQYSLDNGSTWNAFQSGNVIDVSKQSGKQLKIRINLPTDSATLTAIAYAWA